MKKEYRSPMMSLWDFEASNYLNVISPPKDSSDYDYDDSESVKQFTIVSMDSDDDW